MRIEAVAGGKPLQLTMAFRRLSNGAGSGAPEPTLPNSSGSSASMALTGPIEAGDIEIERQPSPTSAIAEIGRPASSPHSV